MEAPDQPKEIDLGPIDWKKDPNNGIIKPMLVSRGFDPELLRQQTMSRYTLQQPLGQDCQCQHHSIVAEENSFLQSCKCSVHVLGRTSKEMIYESRTNLSHLRYSRKMARPLRVPPGCKFVALKSDTGTGKNHQIDVLLRMLLYGQYNQYHTDNDKLELESLRNKLGPNPGCLFVGARCLYDLEMTRKLKVHGAELYTDKDKYDDAPISVWQFHSLWKYDKRAPKIIGLDETTLLRMVLTDTLNKDNQDSNHEMLEVLVKGADLVIVTCATLTQDTINVISMIDPKGKWFIQENTFRTNTGAAVRNHDTLESITNRCVNDLHSGKVLAIASGSLSKLDKFRDEVCERLPKPMQIKHKTFNSKTPGQDKDFEMGLDKALGTMHAIIHWLNGGRCGIHTRARRQTIFIGELQYNRF